MSIRILIIIICFFLQGYHIINAQNNNSTNLKQKKNNKRVIIGLTGSYNNIPKSKYKLAYSYGINLQYIFSANFSLETDICNYIKFLKQECSVKHYINKPYSQYLKSSTEYLKDYYLFFSVKPVLSFLFYKNSKLRFSTGMLYSTYYLAKTKIITIYDMPYEGRIEQTFNDEDYVLKNDERKAKDGYFFIGNIWSTGYEKKIYKNIFVFIDMEYLLFSFKIYNDFGGTPVSGPWYSNDPKVEFLILNEYSLCNRLGINVKF
ncbi:MAG: hypothetical protein HY738_09575 [Bacteroidia bacterium]|nr:hypothetical protein [Bacteroidia bacterium]